jgi:hypothetical protein
VNEGKASYLSVGLCYKQWVKSGWQRGGRERGSKERERERDSRVRERERGGKRDPTEKNRYTFRRIVKQESIIDRPHRQEPHSVQPRQRAIESDREREEV